MKSKLILALFALLAFFSCQEPTTSLSENMDVSVKAPSTMYDQPFQLAPSPVYNTGRVETKVVLWSWTDGEIAPVSVKLNTAGQDNSARLIDGKESTYFFPGWNAELPATVVFDFGKVVSLKAVKIFDGFGQPSFSLSVQESLQSSPVDVYTGTLSGFLNWSEILTSSKGRYWYLTLNDLGGDKPIGEIKFIAEQSSDPVDPPPPPPPPSDPVTPDTLTGSGFWGSCVFPWTPTLPVEAVRVYVSSGWIWRPDGIYTEPFWQASTQNAYGLDTYLSRMRDSGKYVVLCINQTPEWLVNTGNAQGTNNNDHPPTLAVDKTTPGAFAQYASMFAQLARRYGANKHPDGHLRVASGPVFGSSWIPPEAGVKKSGLGTLKAVEIWNEPDKWWKSGPEYIEPEITCAMMTACYDSIKSVAPEIQVIMPGLTGFDFDYLESMDRWFKKNRAGRWACDAMNFHHYSNSGNKLHVWPPTWNNGGGIPPELDENIRSCIKAVKYAKDRGLKVWVTEFGYDTRKPEPAQPWNIWWQYPTQEPAEEAQAQWLVRTYLEYMRMGVERAFLYNGNDESNAETGNLYASSGILYKSPGFQPKPSFFALRAIISDLKGWKYSTDLSTEQARILLYQKGDKTKVVAWLPVSSLTALEMVKIAGCDYTITSKPGVIWLTQ